MQHMDNKEVVRLTKRIHAAARKFKIFHVDDLTQDLLLRLLEGKAKHQTFDQMVIDFMRREFGQSSKGLRKYYREIKEKDIVIYPDPLRNYDFKNYLDSLSKRDGELMYLRYVEGFDFKELAKHFDLSPGGVWIKLDKLHKSFI